MVARREGLYDIGKSAILVGNHWEGKGEEKKWGKGKKAVLLQQQQNNVCLEGIGHQPKV